MTDHHQCFRPIPQLIEELNRHLGDWKNCFDFGYPRAAFGEINTYVRAVSHSICDGAANGPSLPPEEVSYYEQIQRFGLVRL